MHGDAVHADLNGVSCRTIRWTVREVQLNGLDRVNGGPRAGRGQVFSLENFNFVVSDAAPLTY